MMGLYSFDERILPSAQSSDRAQRILQGGVEQSEKGTHKIGCFDKQRHMDVNNAKLCMRESYAIIQV